MKKRTGAHLSCAANLSKVWGPPLITHRDLKPENVMVTDDGRVKIPVGTTCSRWPDGSRPTFAVV